MAKTRFRIRERLSCFRAHIFNRGQTFRKIHVVGISRLGRDFEKRQELRREEKDGMKSLPNFALLQERSAIDTVPDLF